MKHFMEIECPYCGELIILSEILGKGKTYCPMCGVSLKYYQPLQKKRKTRTERINKEVRIAAVQLQILFGYHILSSKTPPALYDRWHEKRAMNRRETIIKIIEHLCRYENPHIICFPELSIPPNILGEIKRLAQKYKVIIVAGSFYTKDNKNCCPIIFPDLDSIPVSEKFYPSPWEDAPNELNRMKPGEKLLIIETLSGKKGIVLMCKDFLEFEKIVNDVLRQGLAFIICPMCTPKLDEFYDRARILMRMGIYSILCNTVGGIMNTNIKFPGGTAFFGAVHKQYLSKEQKKDKEKRLNYLKNEEGIIIATFDLEYTFASTIPTDPHRTTYCNYRDPKIIPLIREPAKKSLRIGGIDVNTLADLGYYLEEGKIKWDELVRKEIVKWSRKTLHSHSLATKIEKCENPDEFKKVIKETISVKWE